MSTKITSISIDKLLPHPGNPNRMSKANFAKLVRHIELSGRYEPLIVRPIKKQTPKLSPLRNLSSTRIGEQGSRNKDVDSCLRRNDKRKKSQTTQDAEHSTQYEIINGHHRFEAIKQLGQEKCDCVVWDVDDDEAALFLATLNRLCGTDVLDKKLAILKKLSAKRNVDELSKLLPQTKTQIARLIELQKSKLKPELAEDNNQAIAYPMVFFLNAEQKGIVEAALSKAIAAETKSTKAARNANAITNIAQFYERSHE